MIRQSQAAIQTDAERSPIARLHLFHLFRLLGVILLSGLLHVTGVMAENTTVQVGLARLEPTHILIAVGDTVTFHNQDLMPGGHTIVGDDQSFRSPPLAKNKSWSHTFKEEGTYTYHIKEHPGVAGQIRVEKKP